MIGLLIKNPHVAAMMQEAIKLGRPFWVGITDDCWQEGPYPRQPTFLEPDDTGIHFNERNLSWFTTDPAAYGLTLSNEKYSSPLGRATINWPCRIRPDDTFMFPRGTITVEGLVCNMKAGGG